MQPSSSVKRTTEEFIILSLSGVSVFCLLPFCVMRVLATDWAIAILDVSAAVVMAAIYLYVYRTGKTVIAGKVMTMTCLIAVFITIYLKGSAQLVWVYPVIVALFFVISPVIGVLFTIVLLIALVPLIFNDLHIISGAAFYISAFATMIFSFAFASQMREQRSQLVALSVSDPLTGVGNRRALDEKLQEVVNRQDRLAIPVSLILLDLDRFKAINDQYGHAEGDKILIKLVQVIQQRIRSTDYLYRFGGEEFVIITENIDLESAFELAEALRCDVGKACLLADNDVTVSLGTAQYQYSESGYDWLGRADKAMYQAKSEGRNMSCVA